MTKSSLIKELSLRDHEYEKRIKELEDNRWPGLWIPKAFRFKPESRIDSISKEVKKFHRYEYGSYTPGSKEWSKKWAESTGKRILFYCNLDTAGSAYRWAEAINRDTSWAARLVSFEIHEFGFPVDLVLPLPEIGDSDLDTIINEASVIQIKDEGGVFGGSFRMPSDFLFELNKPVVFTLHGGTSRQNQNEDWYQEYVKKFDAHITVMPDLAFDWLNAHWVSYPIDTDLYRPTWKPGKIIAHSPSVLKRKGTHELIKAVQLLPESMNIDVNLIHGVSFEESLESRKSASLFFDQAGNDFDPKSKRNIVIGWYGNSAVEAAVLGIPTLAHLSETAITRAKNCNEYLFEQMEIINVGQTAEEISESINWFFNLNIDTQQELSLKTRDWIEKVHSYPVIAKELIKISEKLIH